MKDDDCLSAEYAVRMKKQLYCILQQLNGLKPLIRGLRLDARDIVACGEAPTGVRACATDMVRELNRMDDELTNFTCGRFHDAVRRFGHVTEWAIERNNLTPEQEAALWEKMPDNDDSGA